MGYHSIDVKLQPRLTNMAKLIFSLLLLGSLFPKAWADVNITTTIRPLQLIAESILQDHGSATAIIGANQSPHHYTMSPSDRVALAEADLLLWIGPTFETYLADFFSSVENPLKVLTVSEDENLLRHDIARGQLDSHLWLDTGNAVLIAQSIAELASEQEPANSGAFQQNLNRFKTSIDSLNLEIEESLSVGSKQGYAVYHNAYQYFEKQFALEHQFALLKDSELEPAIRDLVAARRRFDQEKPGCLLLEPDSNPRLVSTALSEHQLFTVETDLLGNRVAPSSAAFKSGYIELMRNLTADFVSCLY